MGRLSDSLLRPRSSGSDIDSMFEKIQGTGYQYEPPKEKVSWLQRIMDLLRRGETAPAVLAKIRGEDAGKAYTESVFGARKKPGEEVTYSDVISELGWRPGSTAGRIAKGTIGLGLDIVADPKTYLTFGIGGAAKVGKVGAKVALSGAGKGLLKKATKQFGGVAVDKVTKKTVGRMSKDAIGEMVAKQAVRQPGRLMAQGGMKFMGATIPGTPQLGKAIGRGAGRLTDAIPYGKKVKEFGREAFKPTAGVSKLGRIGEEYQGLFKTFSGGTRAEIDDKLRGIAAAGKSLRKKYGKTIGESGTEIIETGQIIPKKLGGGDLDAFLSDVVKTQDLFAKTEKSRGLIKGELPDYVRHILTDRAKKDIATKADLFASLSKPLRAKLGAGNERKILGTIREINERALNNKDLGYKLFEPDIFKSYAHRTAENIKAVNTDNFLRTVRKDFGVPFAKGAELTKDGIRYAYSKAPQLKGVAIPEEISKHMDEVLKVLSGDEVTNKFLKFYDKTLSFWKQSVTGYWPAFHTRNFMGGSFNNWLAGLKNPMRYKQGNDIVRGKAGHIVTELGEKISYDDVRKLVKENSVTGMPGFLDVMKTTEDLISTNTFRKIRKYPSIFMEGVEDRLRVPLFIDRLIKGDSAADAAKSVVKHHFDYSPEAFSAFERNFVKRVIPFYTWAKGNVPLQFEQLFKQPGKYASVFKTLRGFEREAGSATQAGEERELMPEWMAGMLTFRLPGLDKSGNPKYVQLDLPLDDLNKLESREVFSMLSPVLKFPIERVSNKNIYFDSELYNKNLPRNLQTKKTLDILSGLPKPIKEFLNIRETTRKNPVTEKEERRVEIDARKLHVVQSFLGRIHSSAKRVLSKETTPVEKASSLLGGVPIRDIDVEEQKYYKEKENERIMRDLLYQLTREGTYKKKGSYGRLGSFSK